jgi:hypothetical protein
VQRRLQAIHPDLFLRFIPHAAQHWAVCMKWQPNEERFAQIQSGEVNPERAHDIIGYLPMDCSAEDAPSYLERMFRTFPNEAVQSLANFVTQVQDATVLGAAMDTAIGEVLDQKDPSKPKSRRTRG